jgi:hypothetical protein
MSRHLTLTIAAAAVFLTFTAGCRDDAGDPDYSSLGPVFDRLSADAAAPKLGPDPYVQGEDRLSLGVFYEGEASEVVAVDGATSNFFIFLAGEQLTYAQDTVTDDVVEGSVADRITLEGTTFWGGGVVWEPARDLSKWTTLAVSLRSNAIEKVNITVGSADQELGLDAAQFGYKADGEWHNLRIPLADYAAGGVDLSAVRLAFAIGAPGGSTGQEIFVDDVYME